MAHPTGVHVNLQTPTPRKFVGSGVLEVHSIFYTIQGEGPLAGRPSVFVRLNDCNLQCPGCDTEYTDLRRSWDPYELAHYVRSKYLAPSEPLIVLTGGEPLRQKDQRRIKRRQEMRRIRQDTFRADYIVRVVHRAKRRVDNKAEEAESGQGRADPPAIHPFRRAESGPDSPLSKSNRHGPTFPNPG